MKNDFRSETNPTTGIANEQYNLISVLYHTLQDCETVSKYAEDAEKAGDEELAQFFNELQIEDRMRAERARNLLSQRLESLQ